MCVDERRAENSLHSWARSTVPAPTGHPDKLASKLKYESVNRTTASRVVEQILDFQSFKLERKGNDTQRDGATFRALSTIIDFGKLQALQGGELSLEPSQLEPGV